MLTLVIFSVCPGATVALSSNCMDPRLLPATSRHSEPYQHFASWVSMTALDTSSYSIAFTYFRLTRVNNKDVVFRYVGRMQRKGALHVIFFWFLISIVLYIYSQLPSPTVLLVRVLLTLLLIVFLHFHAPGRGQNQIVLGKFPAVPQLRLSAFMAMA